MLLLYYLKMQIRHLGALIMHLAQNQNTTRVAAVYVILVLREMAIFVQVTRNQITFHDQVVKYCYFTVSG